MYEHSRKIFRSFYSATDGPSKTRASARRDEEEEKKETFIIELLDPAAIDTNVLQTFVDFYRLDLDTLMKQLRLEKNKKKCLSK